ncbi:hypothetical protein DRF67_19025 [Chryseobacterium pennipullorum]|uniref:Uncharacterized protein n=1 Tax=Chryseobacterium pennipullorum TaxID=2258963 RepID=A0A3D9AQ57_9FLAO|nr:hypothetical protein DRF67_19025 [Chryseobacterium pennipullorum]
MTSFYIFHRENLHSLHRIKDLEGRQVFLVLIQKTIAKAFLSGMGAIFAERNALAFGKYEVCLIRSSDCCVKKNSFKLYSSCKKSKLKFFKANKKQR